MPYHRRDPEFRREAATWLASFADVVKPHLATQGGSVIAVQADIEADMWSRFYAPALGLANAPGDFQQFLQDTYKDDIVQLNDAWETNYHDFAQARAVMLPHA